MEKRIDKFPNKEVESQEEIDERLIALFQEKYGTIEESKTEKGRFYYFGNKKQLCGFADKYDLVEKLRDFFVKGEHLYRNETVRVTEDGEVLTELNCESCGHEFVEGEECYRMNDFGEYLCFACHKEEFPTERSWYEYMIKDYELVDRGGNFIFCDQETMDKLSDEDIKWLANDLLDSGIDYQAFFTEA